MEQSSGGGGKSSAAASSKTPMIAVQKSLKSFFSSVSKDAREIQNDFEMKLSQDENRKPASRGDPVEKSSQKKRRSSAFVKSAAETNGTKAANNDSCATDSTQKVLGNFVESAQKTATRKNTIERTTEEEKKRIERVANAHQSNE